MADHGNVEYATADGNDYPAHEQTYESFVISRLSAFSMSSPFCSVWRSAG